MANLINKSAYAWVVVLALANFLVFVLVSIHLGGDAVSGKVSDGHFFLGSHSHYTEVSRGVFIYSKWHTYSVFVTFPMAFIAAYLSSRSHRKLAGPRA